MAKKKDEEKKAALQARKDAKAGKSAKKRIAKQGGDNDGTEEDSNFDNLIEQYKKSDVKSTVMESMSGFPLPRANATLTVSEDKHAHLYLFGGEYFDGVQNVVLDDLLRWDISKNEWKRILTPAPKPAPRCAHSCVFYKNSLYVLGGELASADQYHHYKDLWKFDVGENSWQEILVRNTGTIPTARSGHAAFVWKHYMIIFGGFYEALRDTRWFNDVCVFDLQTHLWMDIPHSKLTSRPEARSACNIGIYGDVAIIQGGYSKLKNPTTTSEAKVHTDAWMLQLKPILQNKPPTWERLSIKNKSALKSGTASVTYKNRMLVFGGVVDEEQLHHKVVSVFYNDLLALDFEKRKWFPISAKQAKQEDKGRRRKKVIASEEENDTITTEVEDDDIDDVEEEVNETQMIEGGWNLDTLRAEMFAFIDGDGKVVYEKIEDDSSKKVGALLEVDESEEEKEEAKDEEEAKEDGKRGSKMVDLPPQPQKSKSMVSSEVMVVNAETGMPEAVVRAEPLPRINAAVVIRSNILYVYGGLLEVGDREVTLDDCWSFDLKKREKWECLWEGTMHRQVWRGAIHDDDDSYVSAGAEDDDEDDSGDSDDEEFDIKASAKASKKGSKSIRHADRAKLDVNNGHPLPHHGESIADFYSRTAEFWTRQVKERLNEDAEKISSKALKREGFALAQKFFEEQKQS